MKIDKQTMLQLMTYTWEHKKAFLKVEKRLLGRNSLRGYIHDLDKLLFWYPFAWIFNKNSEWVQAKHCKHNRHHIENKSVKMRADYIEMIVDWECARFTKPDKPLNAYETLMKFYPQLQAQIIPLLKELRLIS